MLLVKARTADLAPKFYPAVSSLLASGLLGGSDGSWGGALGIAQRRIPSRLEGEGELGRRLPSELGMRARAVVVGPPTSEGNTSLGQRRKHGLVQQFIPQPAVEAFGEGALHRLARSMSCHSTRLRAQGTNRRRASP